MKYIVVTGGVQSGIGKGVVTSSLGALLKACNKSVTAVKIDPYINIDAGTFSPQEHGEVFVLNDGLEVDLDLGNYERFLDVDLRNLNNITTGKIYLDVINRERAGNFLGKTVQIVPHITNAIREHIERAAEGSDICLIELGGTVGDMEVMPFIEALRQLRRSVGQENFCSCHVSLVTYNETSKEQKSKPTQASVRALDNLGLYPDMIICRSKLALTDSVRDKISISCGVDRELVISLPDLKATYQVPIVLDNQGVLEAISKCLKISIENKDIQKWANLSDLAVNAPGSIIIALVGKYTSLADCYHSVVKSLEHACFELKSKPVVRFIDSCKLQDQDKDSWDNLKTADCLLVPGGFGIRGVEGKIAAIKWARENKMPFLGICLGFQLAAIEYARNVLKITNAHSAEFTDDVPDLKPIVIEMLEYVDPERKLGGTMRLGSRKTQFVTDKSILRRLYNGKDTIEERHRHRYEINPDYIDILEGAGLRFVGRNEDGSRMEVLELDESVHPYFIGVQFHPEYLSRPFRSAPSFKGLMRAARHEH